MTIEEIREDELMEEKVFPSVMNRVQAMFFDFWIIVGVTVLIAYILTNQFEDALVGIKILCFLAVLMIYEPLCNMTGGTLGYRTMGMRLRQYESPERNISFRQAYLRFLVKMTLGWVSFINISTDPFKRAFHDKMSGTIVLIAKIP